MNCRNVVAPFHQPKLLWDFYLQTLDALDGEQSLHGTTRRLDHLELGLDIQRCGLARGYFNLKDV
jgi:hypothetical protein